MLSDFKINCCLSEFADSLFHAHITVNPSTRAQDASYKTSIFFFMQRDYWGLQNLCTGKAKSSNQALLTDFSIG